MRKCLLVMFLFMNSVCVASTDNINSKKLFTLVRTVCKDIRNHPEKFVKELGGIVYVLDGEYGITKPLLGEKDKFFAKVSYPAKAKPIATYHSHPAMDAFFSSTDKTYAESTGLISFICLVDEARLLKYFPKNKNIMAAS